MEPGVVNLRLLAAIRAASVADRMLVSSTAPSSRASYSYSTAASCASEALLPQESMAPVGLLRRVGHKAREEASHLIATRKTAHLGEPWHRNWELDSTHSKVTSGRASGCMGRLFNLVREKKFEEMLGYLDQLGRSQDSLIQQELDVYLYARLMTVCTRDLGPECALPIFELMLQQGEVVPNVVHYTIVIRSLMDLAAHEGNGSTIPGHKGLSEQTSHKSWSSKAIELLKEMRVKGIVPNELTYKPIMAWLPSKGRVVEFEEFKKLMEVDEVPFVGVFKYYEIRLALRVADFDKAKTLFIAAKRENKNIASSLNSWFLMRFALDDQIMELLELLPKILTSLNTSHGIATAFQCLGKHGQLETALQCLSLLKKNGEREQLLGHYLIALILGYTKGKKLDDAENALREVEKKCNVKAEASVFNILIDFCCRQGEVSRGLDFLDEMQQRGLELSTFSFNPFIREFGRWSMVDEAFEMKAAMGRLGVQPSVMTYSPLINACVKLGNMEKAYALLAEMKEVGVEANSHCYNPLIMGFSTKNFDKAMAVVKEMELARVPADVDTYRVLIFACSLSRNQDKAIQLYEQMTERGIKPNQSIYTVMATTFAKCGNLDRSIEMVKGIERCGEAVGTEAKSAILAGLSLAGRLDEAIGLYAEIKKEGVLPTAYAVSSLMAALGKAGHLEQMFAIFEECRSNDQWPSMTHRQRAEHLNIRCITAVFNCIRHNNLTRAVEFLQKVKEEGIADEAVLFDKLFLHISNGGRDENEMCWLDIEDGFAVVGAMRELGLQPSRMALEALLDGCAAMNDSEQAQRVVREMEREGLSLNIFSMIRLFRALVAGEDEEGALALLDKMQVCDLQDSDIQVIIRETLQPHYTAAAESAEAAESPETLPRVRRRVEELMSQD
ncbi:unnamed protein product [Sphagnum troendelagicum]